MELIITMETNELLMICLIFPTKQGEDLLPFSFDLTNIMYIIIVHIYILEKTCILCNYLIYSELSE